MAAITRKNLTFAVKSSPFLQYDFVIEGRRVFGSTKETNRKEAERIARAVYRQARDEAADRRKAAERADITWGDGVASYLARKGDYPSRSADERNFAWLTREIGEGTYLSQITHKTVVELMNKKRAAGHGKRGKPIKDITVDTAVTAVVRKVMMYAREELEVYLPREPKWKRLYVRSEPRVGELMVEMQAKVMRCGRQEVLDPVLFVLETGLRRQAALPKWRQVHLMEGFISIRTKGNVVQEIPITPTMREILLRAEALTGGAPDQPVFTFEARRDWVSPQGTGKRYVRGERYPMTGPRLLQDWHDLCRQAGIERLNIHDLRKTVGARIVRETGCLLSASKALGHANVSMTARHYAHIKKKDVERRVAETAAKTRDHLDRLLGPKPPVEPDVPEPNAGA